MCIGPNGSTPAIVASYTCPTGQTLSGTNCVANLSTVVGGATQDISCPTDSTWNGTACQSTVVTDATLPVGVLCLDGYGSIARDYVIDGTSCTFPSYDPAVIGCPECGGIDPPYPGVAFVVTGCPGLNDFTTYITNVRLEAQSAYRNGDCVLRASSMFYGSACPIPNPARYVLLDTTTPGRLGYMNTSTGVCSYKPAVQYSCPIGYALDANNNCVGTTTTTAIVISYFCPAGGDYVNGSCTTTVTTSATITYSCPMGQTLSGTQCTETTVTTAPATAVYSCPNGGTLSGPDCIAAGQITAAAVTYACAAGSVLSGTTCTTTTTVPATITYSCVDGSAPLNGICRIKSAQSSLTDTCGVYESSAGSMLATP